MNARAFLAAALAGLGLWAGEAQDFTLSATSDLLYRRDLMATGPPPSGTSELRPGQYQYGLSLVGNQGPWTGGITLRDVNFYQQVPNTTLDQATTQVYKRYLKFDSSHWNLQGGDFNSMLGRGLILSVIQNPAILLEDTIDGVDARYRGGPLELHALGGTVTTENHNQIWKVAGAEATVNYLWGNRASVRACTIQDERVPQFLPPAGLRQCHSASLSGQDGSGSYSYYAELAHIDFRDQQLPPWPVLVDPRKGDGAYANLSCHHQAWFLMAEYKDYTNLNDGLNTPPLADLDTEENNLQDGSGRRLYVQYSLPQPDLTLLCSVGAYQEPYLGVLQDGHSIYGGFKLQDGFDRLDLACTYGLRDVEYPEKRTDGTLTWRFTPLWSLDLTLHDKRNRPPGSDAYEETDLTAQVSRSPRFAVYVMQQRSSVAVFDATRLYYAGFRVNLPKGSYLDCSAGRLRGGEVCAGGQCIILPPFKGWKLAAHLRW